MPATPVVPASDLSSLVQKHRTLIISLAILFFMLGGAAVGYSFITHPTRTITVVGTGKKSIPPEEAVVSFSILYENVSQQQAIADGEVRFSQLIKSVENFAPKSVDTTPYQISTRTNTVNAGQVVYQYVNAARITIDKPERVQELIKTLYQNGATVVGQVRYVAKDQEKVDRELQKLAVENATQKAKDMAWQASARLGKVLTIQEGTSTGQSGTSVSSNSTNSPNPTNTQPTGNSNQIELQAQVTVVYELW